MFNHDLALRNWWDCNVAAIHAFSAVAATFKFILATVDALAVPWFRRPMGSSGVLA
jgi:hypothetical protein